MRTAPSPIYEMYADIFKALGHPTRVQIVRYLKDGEHAVSNIVAAVGGEQSNVSRHLSVLKQARVLTSRKDGLKVFYKLSSPRLVEAVDCILSCVQDIIRIRLHMGESLLEGFEETGGGPPPKAHAK